MSGRRLERMQDLVRETVSSLLLFKVKDPRTSSVSVTEVRMTADLRQARIYYAIMDDKADRAEVQAGLERAAGFIRREVGRAVQMKFTPEISFEFDRSLEYSRHMDRVLADVLAQDDEDQKVE